MDVGELSAIFWSVIMEHETTQIHFSFGFLLDLLFSHQEGRAKVRLDGLALLTAGPVRALMANRLLSFAFLNCFSLLADHVRVCS